MSVPVVYNIEGTRGGTVPVAIAITDEDGSTPSLVGYTGEMQVRASAEDDVILMDGAVTIDVPTGVVTGILAAADTAVATWNAAVYDMRILSGATVEYVVRGTIRLRPSVTR